jgi:organic radical activating enzyme
VRLSRLLTPRRPLPSSVSGGISELSAHHVAGWAFRPDDLAARVDVEAALDGAVLARARADQFVHGLSGITHGDGAQGFYARWPHPLSDAELARVTVRPADGGEALSVPAWASSEYTPLMHVAMDIVDNCNLRCPFCLYDYANTHTTHLMDEATLAAALRFLPYTRDGQFWFSCLHEPTLHPRLMSFVDRVPREYRRKLFFTTNLAKRMPPDYFAWLASSGLDHINVSIESRDPAIYERMRKGARHHIFAANWEMLLQALPHGSAPPRLRYIAMAYKSNFRELPELAAYLLGEPQAHQVEVRYTYDEPHIAAEFKQAEYLAPDEWRWLAEQLAPLDPARVVLELPPEAPGPPPPPATSGAVLAGRYMFRLSWDGTLKILGTLADSREGDVRERLLATANVRDIADPETFFGGL